jgi:site-specific DNA recombinase
MPSLPSSGYFRVSDPSQVDGYSLDAQERAYVRWLDATGNIDVGRFRDEGRSAFRNGAQRPDFQRLIAEVRAGRIKIVWVAFSSRFYRDSSQSDELLDEFDRLGIQYVVDGQVIDRSTPMGWGAYKMTSVFDELFSRTISYSTKKGLREKAEQGGWVGPVPLGYERGADGALLPSADAAVIQLAFALYQTGAYSHNTLADELNRRGYRALDWRTGQRRLFGRETIRSILKNRGYLGYVSCSGVEYPGAHQPLIDQATWDACQQIMLQRDSKPGKTSVATGDSSALLNGIMYCYSCGQPLWYHQSVAKRGKGVYYYYRCSGLSRRTCTARQVRADMIEDQVLDLVQNLAIPVAWHDDILRYAADMLAIEHTPAPQQPSRRAIEWRLERLKVLFEEGDYTPDEYRAKRDALRTQLATIDRVPATLDLDGALRTLSSFGDVLAVASLPDRRMLLRQLFSHVYADWRTLKAITPTEAYLPLIGVLCCSFGVADGTRTRNNWNHNPALCH